MVQKIQIKHKGQVIENVDKNARELIIVSSGIQNIQDIEGLDQLVNLEKLTINSSLVTTAGLEKLVSLKELNLGRNRITTIAGLDSLANLEVLCLNNNSITQIKGLDRLVNLKKLALDGNHIARIEGLDQLVSLEKLHLWRNGITKIEGLDHLVNLKVLDLGNNHISKIENLGRLANLEELYLYLNQIAVIEGLSGLVNLKKLDMIQQRKKITMIEGLDGLEKLESINLRATEIAKDEVVDQFAKVLAKMGKEASSQIEYDRCAKMNQKAKAALMAKDLTMATSLLTELKAFCNTRNHQTVNVVYDNEQYGGSEEREQNPNEWLNLVNANLKIVKKAMKASKGPSGFSDGDVEEVMKNWKANPTTTEARPGCIGHAKIPPETKLQARIFSMVGSICGYFIGWAGASPLEGCLFAAISGISMYLLVIAMTFNSDSLMSNTILLVIITAAVGGAGYLMGALGSGDWFTSLGLGLKVGLLLGIVQALGCWDMATLDRLGVLVFLALGAGVGAGIGALIGLFTPAGAGYGASVGVFIGTPVVIIFFSVVMSKSYPFVHAGGTIVGFIVGAFLPVGVGMGAAWGLYIVALAFVIIMLGSTCIRYQQEKFPRQSTWN